MQASQIKVGNQRACISNILEYTGGSGCQNQLFSLQGGCQRRSDPAPVLSAQALDTPQQFGLFTPASAALDALSAIDPDELTPKQALEALYRLKALE